MASPASSLPRVAVRRGWVAALASALLPGLGQWYAGERTRAIQLFGIDLVVVATAIFAVGWHTLAVVKLWVSPAALLLIIAINLVLLLFRALVTVNAYMADGVERQEGLARSTGLALTSLLVIAPHLLVGFVAITQYDLVDTVFAAPQGVVAAAETTTTEGEPETTFGAVAADLSSTTTLPPSTTTTEPPLWDGLHRLNILLLGADAGEGRRGLRTDTTIVVSLDPVSGSTAMFSVPRDLSNAPLPKGMGTWDCNCFPDLITHLYDAAVKNPDTFAGPGEPPINALKGALSEIFGIPIHYYAMVTLDGFVGIVDALGGVTIDVPKTIVDETYPHENGSTESVRIEAGRQHLNGHYALAYARIRRPSNDFARMHRQRCVLGALVDQTSPIDVISRFGAVAEAVKSHVSTDIPQDRLGDLIDLVPKISTDRIATQRITRAEYKTGGAPGRVYYDIEQIRADAHASDGRSRVGQCRTGPDGARRHLRSVL